MMKKSIWFGILLVVINVFFFTGCTNGTTDENGKTIIITNISAAQYNMSDTNYAIGIFPTGTTIAQARAWTGIIAGAGYWDIIASGSPPNLVNSVPLYSFPFGTGKRWTGSGTFDIYVLLNAAGNGFVKRNASITSEVTYFDARFPDASF